MHPEIRLMAALAGDRAAYRILGNRIFLRSSCRSIRLQLDREQTYYIGDSYGNDVIGVESAGWKAIWIDHRRKEIPKGVILTKFLEAQANP